MALVIRANKLDNMTVTQLLQNVDLLYHVVSQRPTLVYRFQGQLDAFAGNLHDWAIQSMTEMTSLLER